MKTSAVIISTAALLAHNSYACLEVSGKYRNRPTFLDLTVVDNGQQICSYQDISEGLALFMAVMEKRLMGMRCPRIIVSRRGDGVLPVCMLKGPQGVNRMSRRLE